MTWSVSSSMTKLVLSRKESVLELEAGMGQAGQSASMQSQGDFRFHISAPGLVQH